MQDITELERRIAAAFDRIDRGLEQADRARATAVALPSAAAPRDTVQAAQSGALLRSLEQAQESNVDWANRYAALEAKMAEATRAMAGDIAKLTEDLAITRSDLQAAVTHPKQPLQTAQEMQGFEEQLSALRGQLAAQNTELTQLRAQRAIEIDELKAIVAALTPLIEEAKPHA